MRNLNDNANNGLRVEDALLYLDQVKAVFVGNGRPHIYDQFIEIMKDFKENKISTPEVIEQVKSMFRDYPALIAGFNCFLPNEAKIELELSGLPSTSTSPAPAATSTASGQQRDAINYVTKVRSRFQDDQATYQAFLKTLYQYKQDQMGITEVLEQVSQLFGNHPDLIDEFVPFLPDGAQEQARERLSRAAMRAQDQDQA
jgi:paired amphipathic helix protein Sin3a